MISTNDENQKVRLHVHWGMKIVAIFSIFISFLNGYGSWQSGSLFSGIFYLLMGLLSVWVFFLTFTQIDAGAEGIEAIVPYGKYVMRWDEVKSVEKKKNTVYFFGDNKAFSYDLLLAGKGKRELKEYVDQIIIKWQFETGRPEGVSNSQVRKWMKNCKAGKGILF